MKINEINESVVRRTNARIDQATEPEVRANTQNLGNLGNIETGPKYPCKTNQNQ